MKKKIMNTFLAAFLLVMLLGLAGCPDPSMYGGPDNHPSSTDPAATDNPAAPDATPSPIPTPVIIDAALSVELVGEATDLMTTGDLEGAYSKFSMAILMDPTNGNAQIGYALLNIASIATAQEMVELAGNRLKFNNYPTSMNEFYTGAWFTKEVASYMNVYDSTTQTITTTMYIDLMPEISIPPQIASWEDNDETIITYSEYTIAFLYNFINANPNGLNNLVDDVVYKVLGSRLDLAISAIKQIPDNVTFTITPDMFSTFGLDLWPKDAENNNVNIVIGKEELLIESAGLKFIKSQLELVTSYDLTLPLTEYWEALNPVDGDIVATGLDIESLTTPFAAGFLFARDDAQGKLDNARRNSADALHDMVEAMTRIIDDRPGMFLSSSSPSSLISSNWDTILTMLKYNKALYVIVKNSVRNNTNAYIPIDVWNYPNPMDFFNKYSNAAYWPTEADWGSEWTSNNATPPTIIALNFGAIYSGNILALNALIQVQEEGANKGEPVFYKFTYTDPDAMPLSATGGTLNTTPVTSMTLADAQENGVLYALKFKDLTLGGLFVFSDSTINEFKKLINELYSIPNVADQLVVKNPDGSVSVYLPVVPPVFAYEAYGDSYQSISVNYGYLPPGGYQHTTYGSFWWSYPDLLNYSYDYYVNIYYLSVGEVSETISKSKYREIFYVTGMDPSTLYQFEINSSQQGWGYYITSSFPTSGPNATLTNSYITGIESVWVSVYCYNAAGAEFTVQMAEMPTTSVFPATETGSMIAQSNGQDNYLFNLDPSTYYRITLSASEGAVYGQVFETIDLDTPIDWLYAETNASIINGITGIDSLFISIGQSNSEGNTTYTLTIEELVVTEITPGEPLTGQSVAAEAVEYYEVILDNASDYELQVTSPDGNFEVILSDTMSYSYYSWTTIYSGTDRNITIPSGLDYLLITVRNYETTPVTFNIQVASL